MPTQDPQSAAPLRNEALPTAAAPDPAAIAKPDPRPHRLRRALLAAAGTLCVGLGLIGVVVPLLPTTPFLLLAAACYARSSDRLYRWLFGNRLFGDYLRRYRAGEGMPRWSKVATLLLLWLGLGASVGLAVPSRLWWLSLLLVGIGLGVTVHILGLRTRRGPPTGG